MLKSILEQRLISRDRRQTMITGTIYNAGKMLEMTQKWEQKKSSGNILKKEVKELSPEEQQLKMYQEQLEREREGNEYSSIYAKIQSGQELSPAEEDKLRAKDPKMYMEYKADRMEQEAYEKKLKNCKTKEEAERLHVNRMNGKLSEHDNIVDNAGSTMKDTQHSVALETEKKVLEEMFELEKNHFGESKKAVKIDVSL